MKITVKQRLIDFINYLGITKNAFEENCNLSLRAVSNIKSTIRDDTLKKIVLRYPELNPEWLMLGEGSMLRASAPQIMQNNVNGDNNYNSNNNYVRGGSANTTGTAESDIPTLDTEEVERAPIVSATIARAPEVDILETVQEKRDELEKAPVGVFNAPVSIWYRVQDESLAPKYEIGDLIALWAYPKGEEDPIPGKLYGINTSNNGLLVRRLFPQEDGGYIARAMNREEFPDYHIKSANVVQVYKIMLMVRF